MDEEPAEAKDIQLRFDGSAIAQRGGAPADLVISALTALQRITHLIGMKSEGREFGQRAKPSAKVRRDYSVICRPTQQGSHIQPFDVGSFGETTGASLFAREKLLRILRAFDSGDADIVEQVLPDARERWFLANAAMGLIPPDDSKVQVSIRPGSFGPFAFKADRAKPLVSKFSSGRPPVVGFRRVVGKVHGIDYTSSLVIIKPTGARIFRVLYPAICESMIQANGRKRIVVQGTPELNAGGDVVDFKIINAFSEAESSIEPILSFDMDGLTLTAIKPLRVSATFDYFDRLFTFQDTILGIDAYSETYEDLRKAILKELSMLWRNYALADDEELDLDALSVKQALLSRFREV